MHTIFTVANANIVTNNPIDCLFRNVVSRCCSPYFFHFLALRINSAFGESCKTRGQSALPLLGNVKLPFDAWLSWGLHWATSADWKGESWRRSYVSCSAVSTRPTPVDRLHPRPEPASPSLLSLSLSLSCHCLGHCHVTVSVTVMSMSLSLSCHCLCPVTVAPCVRQTV
jgi:hypothetical protein